MSEQTLNNAFKEAANALTILYQTANNISQKKEEVYLNGFNQGYEQRANEILQMIENGVDFASIKLILKGASVSTSRKRSRNS